MSKKPQGIQGSFNFDKPAETSANELLTVTNSPVQWIVAAKNAPYFTTENGEPWTPVGQNDAITWPELAGAFRRKNMAAVDSYFNWIASNGVTCLRLMLEYCQGENRYLEKPAGYFQPNMIQLWDDIFALCEKYSLRILLTPYDTFWMWRRWSHHPYNKINNGPCTKRSQWLLCPDMRAVIKARLYFATKRWGGSGVLFGWDLWNEIRPSHGGNSSKGFTEFIDDVGGFLRKTEIGLYGRAHPQTVSVFSPVLQKDLRIAESVFHHQALDFATIHLYEHNTIDNPKNTIGAAIATGQLIRQAVKELKDHRPFFDSEHGPIKTFNSYRRTLPADFDDEYFRHMQWAHVASGGAGGGMRWPYRHPHVLTTGMRSAQFSLSKFLQLIAWSKFNRVNLNEEIKVSDSNLAVFGCGDENQAVVWLLRTNATDKNKMLRKDVRGETSELRIPLLNKGTYRITLWDTLSGEMIDSFTMHAVGDIKISLPAVATDLAMAVVNVNL